MNPNIQRALFVTSATLVVIIGVAASITIYEADKSQQLNIQQDTQNIAYSELQIAYMQGAVSAFAFMATNIDLTINAGNEMQSASYNYAFSRTNFVHKIK